MISKAHLTSLESISISVESQSKTKTVNKGVMCMFIQGLAGVGYSWQTVGNEIAQGRLRLIVPGFERAECFDFVSYKGAFE